MSLEQKRIVDPVLTKMAIGFVGNEYAGHNLMPFVDVDKEAGKIVKFGKDDFVETQTERAVRADSNIIDTEDPTTDSFSLTEHDLGARVDYREEQEAMFPQQVFALRTVQSKIALRRELKIARLAQDINTYPATNRITLSGSDQFTHADSDPEGVVDTASDAIRTAIGHKPNTMVMGPSTWRALKRHPALRALLGTNQKRLVRLSDLAEIFEVENIHVGYSVQAATSSSQFTNIWLDNMVLAYVDPGVSAQDTGVIRDVHAPSFGYVYRKRGWPQVDKYALPGNKVQIVRATEIFEPYVVGAVAGYLVANTNA